MTHLENRPHAPTEFHQRCDLPSPAGTPLGAGALWAQGVQGEARTRRVPGTLWVGRGGGVRGSRTPDFRLTLLAVSVILALAVLAAADAYWQQVGCWQWMPDE